MWFWRKVLVQFSALIASQFGIDFLCLFRGKKSHLHSRYFPCQKSEKIFSMLRRCWAMNIVVLFIYFAAWKIVFIFYNASEKLHQHQLALKQNKASGIITVAFFIHFLCLFWRQFLRSLLMDPEKWKVEYGRWKAKENDKQLRAFHTFTCCERGEQEKVRRWAN